MKQLGAQDSQFLFMENSNNLSNVVMVGIYGPAPVKKGETLFELIKSHVESRVHTSSIFTRKLVRVPLDLDFPYWADDEFFDLEGHIHYHRFPAPGDWAQLTDLVGRVHSRPLDMNRPLWEMHVVENLSGCGDLPEGSFALLTKVHHAAVDGAAMVKFFACLSDIDAEGTPVIDISKSAEKSGEAPRTEEIWSRFLSNHLQSPLRMAQTLWRSAPAIAPALLKSFTRDDCEKTRVPETRFNQKVAPRKIFDAVEYELEDFKAVQKKVEGAKINDVVLAVCSGAVRKYLMRHKELPEDSLVAWVPVNTRKAASGSDDESGGNQITAMTTDLCTVLDDPIERMKEITRQTRLSKEAKAGVSARVMTDVTQSMPGATLALVSHLIINSGITAKLCNLAISNVPGTQVPIFMKGARCLHQYGMTPLGDGMGLFFVALSYNGKLTLSITTNREIVPDIDVLKDCMVEALGELKSAKVATARRTSTRKRTGQKSAGQSRNTRSK